MSVYGLPHYAHTDSSAVRDLSDGLNVLGPDGKPNKVRQHPEDYSLYFIGIYDDETGNIVPNNPVCLVNASSLINNVVESPKLDQGIISSLVQ